MQNFILFTIILIEGFVSIATEILTIRQLLPVVGNSIEVTSYIIGTFLLALAYGYKRGGKYTDNLSDILIRNFIIASLLLGMGLSHNFVTIFFIYFQSYALVLYLLFVLAPLVYLLGQTVPITMNLLDQKDRVGLIGSRVLHLSTIGSFLGSILTTVLFMNIIGVTWTVIINSLLLLTAAFMLAPQKKALFAIITCFGLSMVFVVNFYTTNPKIIHTNAYNTYQILDDFHYSQDRHGKLLVINHSGSSFLDDKTLIASESIEMMKKIIFTDLQLTKKEILVLGAGGFSLSAADDFGNNFTYVDIDPDMKKVAEAYFVPQIKGDFIAQDARQYLLHTSQSFPVIIADAYSNRQSIPAHLVTKEFFQLLKSKLSADGIAIINAIINPTLGDQYSRTVDATIRSVFDSCMSIPKAYENRHKNVIYVCNKNENILSDKIYSDDLNRSALDKIAIN